MESLRTMTPDRLATLGRVAAVAVSPCDTWAAVAVARPDERAARYVHDLWRLPLDGGAPLQLTTTEADDRAPAFRPDGDLLFLSDRPLGGEKEDPKRTRVWCLPAGGGEARVAADAPLGIDRFGVAADTLVIQTRVWPNVADDEQRDHDIDRRRAGPSGLRYDGGPARFWDHWLPATRAQLVAIGDGAPRVLVQEQARELRFCEWQLRPDGRAIAYTSVVAASDRLWDASLHVVDTQTGESISTWCPGPGAGLGPLVWRPDGGAVATTLSHRSMAEVGPRRLVVYTPGDADVRGAGAAWDRWPTPVCWTASGLVALADDEGAARAFRVDLDDETQTPLPSAGSWHALDPRPGGGWVGIGSSFRAPPEVYALDTEAAAALAPLSEFNAEAAPAIRVVNQRVTRGDRDIQMWVVSPADANGDVPLVVWIHGGPMSAWNDQWHWRWNVLTAVAAGFAVALPNPAGSTGFGQSWVEDVWGNAWGGACYDDVMACADAASARSGIDESRTAAMGGSFGGYMTAWIGANTDRFRCLVTHAGIASLPDFHSVTDAPPWRVLSNGGIDPWRDRPAYDRYSPLARVANWSTPTLIVHGERDYRVPISEALTLYEALQHHGVPVSLLVYPDENHWILKPRNVVSWYDEVLAYLGRHLDA